jgi:integrase
MDGETQYRLRITVGTRVDHLGKKREIQECYTFKSLAEARGKHDEIRDAKRRKVHVKRESVTFDELCYRWLDSRHDVREVTVLGYRYALKVARELLGQEKVQELDRADVEKVIKTLEKRNLSHRSVGYTLGTIKQVLAYGISSGLLSINVAASVKLPRKQRSKAKVDTKAKDEAWSPAELDQFRAVTDQHEWAACWRLTFCGLRRSEVMGLKWDAVDLDNGQVLIKAGRVSLDGGQRTATDDPKSKAPQRTVPVEVIQPGTVALLRALSARQAADRLKAGAAYAETGYVLVDALGRPGRRRYRVRTRARTASRRHPEPSPRRRRP